MPTLDRTAPQIIQGQTSGGTTAFYVMRASGALAATVTVRSDGHAWCAQCTAQKADRCQHVIAVAALHPARAARNASVLARLAATYGQVR